MSLLRKKHGTRKSYLNGCRCKDCCAANSAYIYVRRFVAAGRFDVGVLSTVRVTEALMVDNGRYMIPEPAINEALMNVEETIKAEVMRVMWRRRKEAQDAEKT